MKSRNVGCLLWLSVRFLYMMKVEKMRTLVFIKAFVLDVRDPSDVVWTYCGALIVGDGVQFIDLKPYLLPPDTTSSRSSL
ncbi:hypothetical protein ANCCAN_25066 [Ancylostoma caninum]|uniref:Uncharacterized protein n=1 Tax=Ancylostoma caninum TaxID=29170 RepID=A0A368FDU7_ANCCA|nr:hypothetical protein ANCCAN_25066 [Ancylostoma caninum]